MNRYIHTTLLLLFSLSLYPQGPSFNFSSHRLCQKQIIIKVSVQDFTDIHAFKFPIVWNPQVIKLIKVDSCNLPEFSPADFDLSLKEEGVCYINWKLKTNLPGQNYATCTIKDNQTIFELHFIPLREDVDSNVGIHFELPDKSINVQRFAGNYLSIGFEQKEALLLGCHENSKKTLWVDLKDPGQNWSNRVGAIKKNNFALLFAIDEYKFLPDLRNPVKDAHLIANELKTNYGFDTKIIENVGFDSIDVTLDHYIQKFTELADTTSQLLIFFSGHGQRDEFKKGYFLAQNTNPNNLYRTGLGYEHLDDRINKIPCKHILVCIDACYSGSFDPQLSNRGNILSRPNELSDQEKFLREHNKTKTRLFFTSALDTAPSPDKSNFAAKFLESLKMGANGRDFLTVRTISSSMEAVNPKPHFGPFGDNEPGSTFIFYPNNYFQEAPIQIIKDNAGKIYKTVKIANLEWLAEDMHYDIESLSWVLQDSLSKKHNFYGRFYNYQGAAVACLSLGNSWRLPTFQEWKDLIESYGGYGFTSVKITDENYKRLYYYPSKSKDLVSAALALTYGGESGLNLSTNEVSDNSQVNTLGPRIQKHVAYWSSTSADGAKLEPFEAGRRSEIFNFWRFDPSHLLSVYLSKKAVHVGYANYANQGLLCRCVR